MIIIIARVVSAAEGSLIQLKNGRKTVFEYSPIKNIVS